MEDYLHGHEIWKPTSIRSKYARLRPISRNKRIQSNQVFKITSNLIKHKIKSSLTNHAILRIIYKNIYNKITSNLMQHGLLRFNLTKHRSLRPMTRKNGRQYPISGNMEVYGQSHETGKNTTNITKQRITFNLT